MKKLFVINKHILYIAFVLIMCLFLSGCGLPKEYDFSKEKSFYNTKNTEIKEIFDFFESNNWHSIYKDHNSEKFRYSINENEDNFFLSDEDVDMEQKLFNLDVSTIYKSNTGDIMLDTYNNGLYFKSYKDIEDIECPFYFSVSGDDLKLLNLKKEIDGDKIHFIADHRKDKKTRWKKMYYRIDVEKLDTNIYVYNLQRKYPWNSSFME